MPKTELAWWQWLLYSPLELRYLGFYPDERVRHTGHRRALAHRWSLTVGMWGWSSAKEIREVSGSSWKQYWSFKRYWGLCTKRSAPVSTHVRAISRAHAEMVVRVAEGKPEGFAAIGAAEILGILPVEALLYYKAVKVVLERNGVSAVQFHGAGRFSDNDKYLMILRSGMDLSLPRVVFGRVQELVDEQPEETTQLHGTLCPEA